MTPASKGAAAKKVPASRPAAAKNGHGREQEAARPRLRQRPQSVRSSKKKAAPL